MHLKQESPYARKVQRLILLEQFHCARIALTPSCYGCMKHTLFQQELTCYASLTENEI